jgi:hypothetical protein
VGSRADDKLKEIEQLRASLGSKLEEIENRFPVAGMGKKVAAALAGSSVAGSVLAFGFRRVRGGGKAKRTKRRGKHEAPVAPVVTVNVFPKGAAWLAAAGLAGWAGVKVYDALKRNRDGEGGGSFRPSVVTMPEPGRGAGGN